MELVDGGREADHSILPSLRPAHTQRGSDPVAEERSPVCSRTPEVTAAQGMVGGDMIGGGGPDIARPEGGAARRAQEMVVDARPRSHGA